MTGDDSLDALDEEVSGIVIGRTCTWTLNGDWIGVGALDEDVIGTVKEVKDVEVDDDDELPEGDDWEAVCGVI